MHILHLAYIHPHFVFWAETPLPGPQPEGYYPYQVKRQELGNILKEMGIANQPRMLKTEKAVLWAPATENGPTSSTSGVAVQAPVSLQPFTLEGIRLPGGKVLDWLGSAEALTATDKWSMGIEMEGWQRLYSLALSLVRRQQLLPDLEQIENEWFARWQPLLQQEDHLVLAELQQHMPEVVQALNHDTEQPPFSQLRHVLMQALGRLTDTLVRRDNVGGEYSPRKVPELSVEARWTEALRRRNGLVQGVDPEFIIFRRHIQRWTRPLRVMAEAPFQLVFQLEEPTETSESWFVRLLLHSREEPDLYVPIEVMHSDNRPEILKTLNWPLEVFVNDALEQAALRIPDLGMKLLRAHSGMELQPAQVEYFLMQAPALEQNGFGLRLPAWWLEESTPLRGQVRVRPLDDSTQAQGHISLNTLLHADWELMLGDHPISFEELKGLAELKSPLVHWRGRWLKVSPEDMKRALSLWRHGKPKQMALRDVLLLGPQGEHAPFEITSVEVQGWLADFLAELRGEREIADIDPPVGFTGTLRHYQQRGVNWLAFLCGHGLGGCLADDMGLGKTIQTLALMQHFYEKGEIQPSLLVCPTSLLDNWRREAQRFVPEIPVKIHHGSQRDQGEDFISKVPPAGLVITSYALLHRDAEFLSEVKWAGLILDEAQNIKNAQTKQSQTARGLPSRWKLALTGTPVENHVGDLWTLMDFLNQGLLGTRRAFKTLFLTPIQRWQDKHALKQLHHLTAPFILRRLKTDPTIVPDLPDKQESKTYCTLTVEQASLYSATVDGIEEQLAELDGMARRGLVLASLSKLKQICNHPSHFLKEPGPLSNRSGKLNRLEEMLEEVLAVDEKALVFTQFAEMGKLLQQYLSKRFDQDVFFLHGGTPRQRRTEMVENFQNNKQPAIFVLSLKAGGTGLNLTAANHVFHYDRWWNPAVENQATDRAYRIGQTRNVQVHKLVCSGTLEERIDDMLSEKQELAEQIVGSGENWITELSDDELRTLFRLSADLVTG